MRKYIFGGNWKMQLPTNKLAVERARLIADQMSTVKGVDAFIAPSPNTLFEVGKSLEGSDLKLAAQNMHFMKQGAFTGEVSVEGVLEAGCEYVLLGHSERRRIFSETNKDINKKIKLALENDLKVVLCIGETAKERSDGLMAKVNKEELSGSLDGINENQLKNLVVAYEPVWAINNVYLNPGIEIKAATVDEAIDSHKIVRGWFIENYGLSSAEKMRIQYGGSMKPSNASELLKQEDIDGGLIGGASLNADSFTAIMKSI